MENSGLQPGQTIAPGSTPAPSTPDSAPPQASPTPPLSPSPAPSSPPENENLQTETSEVPPAPEVPTGLEQPEEVPSNPEQTEITWTASEFVAHEKSASWYMGLAVAAAAIAGLIYLITRDFVSVGVVLFGAFMLGVYGARQPRQLDYSIDPSGVTIGQKYYPFSDFRTFSIIPEGAFSSIVFMPLKRFAPPTTIYYDPKDENSIVAVLSNSLPFEEGKHDAVERLMRRIRF